MPSHYKCHIKETSQAYNRVYQYHTIKLHKLKTTVNKLKIEE